jgi:uncharacterized MAPEG superfamily protein
MSVELTMLVYATGILIVCVLVQAFAGIFSRGLKTMAGPRDDLPPMDRFHARASRTVDNHREGLVMFAPLILAAAVAGVSNQWTLLGAQIFFWARLVHAPLYWFGVPWLRAGAWGASLAATVMVLLALVGVI